MGDCIPTWWPVEEHSDRFPPTPPDSRTRQSPPMPQGGGPPAHPPKSPTGECETDHVLVKVHSARRLDTAPKTCVDLDPKSAIIELVLEADPEVDLSYCVGDAFGIRCPNSDCAVESVFRTLQKGNPNIQMDVPFTVKSTSPCNKRNSCCMPDNCDLRTALTWVYDLRQIPKRLALRSLAEFCQDPAEKQQLLLLASKEGKQVYTEFIEQQQVCIPELLELFSSCRPSPAGLFTILPSLSPRFYSVCSSPLAHSQRFTVAFSVLEYTCGTQEHPVKRKGLCTTWLAEKVLAPWLASSSSSPGADLSMDRRLQVVHRPSKEFTLPSNPSFPLIMVGPGTGVAPFLGFMQHRHRAPQR